MAEPRMSALLAGLADPVQPDPDFRESLFEALIAEIDFGHGDARVPARSTGLFSWSVTRRRALWILAIALLAAAALLGVSVLGQHRDGVLDLLRRSQEAYRNPPAFDITAVYPGHQYRYRFNGSTLRADPVLASQDSVGLGFLFDGRTYYRFFAPSGIQAGFIGAVNATGFDGSPDPEAVGLGRPFDPLGRTSPLAAFPLAWPYVGNGASPDVAPCEDPIALSTDRVAGRAAVRISCRLNARTGQFWIDVSSGLVVRMRPAEGPNADAERIQISAQVDPATFELPHGPAGEPPVEYGAMPRGTYAVMAFPAPFTLQLDGSWYNASEGGLSGSVQGPGDVRLGWASATLDRSAGSVSLPGGQPPTTAVDAFINWYATNEPGVLVPAGPIALKGVSAMEYEVRPSGPSCEPIIQPSCSDPGGDSGTLYRAVVVEIRGQVVVIGFSSSSNAGLSAARSVVRTIRFN